MTNPENFNDDRPMLSSKGTMSALIAAMVAQRIAAEKIMKDLETLRRRLSEGDEWKGE